MNHNHSSVIMMAVLTILIISATGSVVLLDENESDAATFNGFNINAKIGDSVNQTFQIDVYAIEIRETSINFGEYGLSVNAARGSGLSSTIITISGTATKTIDSDFTIRLYNATSLNHYVNGHIKIEDNNTAVSSISISGPSSGEVGESITLTASVSPSNATNKAVTWSITSGASYANITSQNDDSCTIALTGSGSITVRATADDGSGVSATKTVSISESEVLITSISISGSSSGEVGDSITLTATATPSGADNRGVTFSITSGSSRATITSQSETSTGGRCTIMLESAGSITVTATASDGSGVTKTKTITITEPEILVTSVSISGGSTVLVGSTLTLTATTSPSSADDRTVNWSITNGSSHVTYTISNTSTGGRIVLTGVSEGSVTVRATAADGSGEYATKTITVQSTDIEITSSQGDETISTGTAFSYVVNTNVSGCTISVSGADWLQVSGNTVYGTPSEAGDFDITITASKSGYTSDTQSFAIKVVSSLSFTSVPTTGLIIVEV